MKIFKIKGALLVAFFAMLMSCQTEQLAIEDSSFGNIDTQGVENKEYYYKGKLLTDDGEIDEAFEKSFGAIETDGKVEIYETENDYKQVMKSPENNNTVARTGFYGQGVSFGAKGVNDSNRLTHISFYHTHTPGLPWMFYENAIEPGIIATPQGTYHQGKQRHMLKLSTIMGLRNRMNIVNHIRRPVRIVFFLKNSAGVYAGQYAITVRANGGTRYLYNNQTRFNMNANGSGGVSNRRVYGHRVELL